MCNECLKINFISWEDKIVDQRFIVKAWSWRPTEGDTSEIMT
jgi:hypothetical protein